jgi:hypothetical protein
MKEDEEASMGESRNAYKNVLGNSKGNRPLRISRRR